MFEGGVEEFGQPVFFLSDNEFINQSSGVVETNPMTLPTSSQTQSARYMTFAKAGITDHDYGLDFGNVLPAG